MRFGVEAPDLAIDTVAQLLAAALQIRLHKLLSMDGPWYSSVNISQQMEALRAGKAPKLPAGPQVALRFNDPEPGYKSKEHALGGTYILEVTTSGPEESQAVEKALAGLDLSMRRLP